MKKIDLENDEKIESGFKIPDNYFDSFEDRLMQRISEEEKPVKVISLWQRKSKWISGIAAAVVISIGTWLYFEQKTTENIEMTQDYLTYEADVTTEEIAMLLTNEDLTHLESEITEIDTQTENYINDYLN
ncbi:hypothetical protein [Flavobacterium sp. H122]|uniref:hypothetical protein n=1 Tax=Flavobacterium sp. H122 TaxID=2529860 RepID=UPI0010AB1364|nr:hypothetical protein [Flavobacterium sp. H122]